MTLTYVVKIIMILSNFALITRRLLIIFEIFRFKGLICVHLSTLPKTKTENTKKI